MPDVMDSTDTEMTEREAVPVVPQQQGSNDVVKELITLARQFTNQGKPSQALQAVVMAMRTKGGDEAVFQSLHRARELYRSRKQKNTAVDQLAAFFAECAIAEAQPSQVESSLGVSSMQPDVHGNSILLQKLAGCKLCWMHFQMGAASSVYSVVVLLATIAKMSIMPTGFASSDVQKYRCQFHSVLKLD